MEEEEEEEGRRRWMVGEGGGGKLIGVQEIGIAVQFYPLALAFFNGAKKFHPRCTPAAELGMQRSTRGGMSCRRRTTKRSWRKEMRRRWSSTTKVRTRKRKRRRRSRKGGGRVIRKGENRNDCGVLVVRVTFFCLARRRYPPALYASHMLHVQRSRRKK